MTTTYAEKYSFFSALRQLNRIIHTEHKLVMQLYLYAIITGLLSLGIPLGVQSLVGLISGGLILQPAILLIALVTLGFALSGLLQLFQVNTLESIQQRVFARLAFHLSTCIPNWELLHWQGQYFPEAANRFFDITHIQKGLVKLLSDFTTAILKLAFGLILITLYHPYFIAFGLLLIVGFMVLFSVLGSPSLRTSIIESKHKYRLGAWIQQLASALPATHFTQKWMSVEKTDGYVADYLSSRQAHFRLLQVQYVSLIIVNTIIVSSLLILGSYLVIDKQISLGQFVAAELVIVTVLSAVDKLVLNLDSIYDLLTSVIKVADLTDAPAENKEGILLESTLTGIALEAVDFSVSEGVDQIINPTTFRWPAGSQLALVSDDSYTTAVLLQRLAACRTDFAGRLQYEGLSIQQIRLDSLRSRIGEVLSLDSLFQGTLGENLLLPGGEASLWEHKELLERIGVWQKIIQLRDGFHHPVLPGGRGIDSSTAILTLIARHALHKPQLWIIDHLLDTLSFKDKEQVLSWLLAQENKPTVLIATRDAWIVAQCRQTLLLRNGTLQLVESPVEWPQLLPYLSSIPDVQPSIAI